MVDRKRIKQYSRQMEDKMEDRLVKIGFELVEDTGRRTTGAGDRVMLHPDTGVLLVVDHKSTQSDVWFKISRDQLDKIGKEAKKYSNRALPAITFNYKGDSHVYIILDIADLEGVMY